jgi:hypothetical protein
MRDVDYFLGDKVIINEKYVNKTLKTIASDTEDDGTIGYRMNEHGYRSESFKDKHSYNVLTLGCSWTMGVGVEYEHTWPYLMKTRFQFVKEQEVGLFNYGMYGASPSFIAKNLYKIVTTEITPDVVLIMWPGFSRRDYLKEDGSFRKIGGFRKAHDKDPVWRNDDEDLLFLQLRNDNQDLMEFWEAYKFVELIAAHWDIKIYHTIAGYYYEVFKSLEPNLKQAINYDTFFDPSSCYKNDFKGRDGEHPGKDWHLEFTNNFFKFIKNRI